MELLERKENSAPAHTREKKALSLKNAIKASVFVIIGGGLLLLTQEILTPVWNYPDHSDNISFALDGFYELQDDTLQALFFGTSHMSHAVSPMEIYEKYHLLTYNLGTSVQPIEGVEYLLEEAIERQSPNVVMLDVSGVFFGDNSSTAAYRYLMDSMPLSSTKIEMAFQYAQDFPEKSRLRAWAEGVLPLLYYHDRWDALDRNDFEHLRHTGNHLYGYCASSVVGASPLTVQEMNDLAYAIADRGSKTIEYFEGTEFEKNEDGASQSTYITEKHYNLLKKFQNLCNEAGAELILVKIPSVGYPMSYTSSWTEKRSSVMKTVAEELGIPFLDLLYDADVGMNWQTDTKDGGGHLNYLGARKISDHIGQYLMNNCGLEPTSSKDYETSQAYYEKYTQVMQLQTTQSLDEYLRNLHTWKGNISVFVSSSDDMASGLTSADIAGLKKLGFQSDFKNIGYGDAFLGLISNNQNVYEGVSEENLMYTFNLPQNEGETKSIELESAGFYEGAKSVIKINGVDYSMNCRGLNIVVYDNETGKVIDSVAFDTYEENHAVTRTMSTELFHEYERALLKQYQD